MKKNHTNLNDIITIKEAASILGKSKVTVNNLIKKGVFKVINDKPRKVSKKQVENYKQYLKTRKIHYSPFGSIALDTDEYLRNLESYHNPNSIYEPLKYQSEIKYQISNKGRIFNMTHCHELSQSIATHGYLQVGIRVKGKTECHRVHVLVAYVWCPNSRSKPFVHHIDNCRTNNNASNLVWVSLDEHQKAHKILDEAKKTGDYAQYYHYIGRIQNQNQWKREYRRIVQNRRDGSESFITVDKRVYEEYLADPSSLEANDVIVFMMKQKNANTFSKSLKFRR